jgi:structure-specific recognition protein 1
LSARAPVAAAALALLCQPVLHLLLPPIPLLVQVPSSSIKTASWHDVGRSCQLWLGGQDGAVLQRLEGFRSGEFERIAGHLQSSMNVKLAKKELSAKGRNFGSVRVRGAQLELVDDEGALVMPLPLAGVAQAQKVGASELEVECAVDDTVEREDEVLVDMRFYIPPGLEIDGVTSSSSSSSSKKAKASSGGDGGGDGDEDDEDGAMADGGGPAAALAARIKEVAGIRGSAAGEALVELPEDVGSFLVPRGRFSIELFPTYMRLGGASFEFKVQYKSIARVTYLPIPAPSGTWADATRYAIVISLDDPLRQGNQRHPHLVLQLDNKDITVPLNIPAEDIKAKRYEGLGSDGSDSVQGMLPKVVGSLLKKVAGKPVFKPETFESAGKQRAVRCTHKGQTGLLFPLDKSMMFIHKPTVWIRYQEVEAVEVQRYDGSGPGTARTWDLVVKCRAAGGEAAREYLFQGLDRSEKAPLVDFFKARGLRTIEEEPRRAGAKVSYAGESSGGVGVGRHLGRHRHQRRFGGRLAVVRPPTTPIACSSHPPVLALFPPLPTPTRRGRRGRRRGGGRGRGGGRRGLRLRGRERVGRRRRRQRERGQRERERVGERGQ